MIYSSKHFTWNEQQRTFFVNYTVLKSDMLSYAYHNIYDIFQNEIDGQYAFGFYILSEKTRRRAGYFSPDLANLDNLQMAAIRMLIPTLACQSILPELKDTK